MSLEKTTLQMLRLEYSGNLRSISWLGFFKIQTFFSCIVAFYSPMMHAKRNSYAKFHPNWCGFGPPVTHFMNSAWRALKNAKFTIHKKNQNCPRALQVGSFCGEWRGEQIVWKNLCSKIDSTLWKYTFIVKYWNVHPSYTGLNQVYYNKCIFSQCRIDFRAQVLI